MIKIKRKQEANQMSEKLITDLKKKWGFAKKTLTQIESLYLRGDEPSEETYVHLEILEKALLEFERSDQPLEKLNHSYIRRRMIL